MSGKKLLPYLIVLLVAVVALVLTQTRQERQEAKERAAKQVFALKGDDIRQITLKKPSGDIVLNKNGAWHLTRPLAAPADAFTVNSLLATLTDLEKQRTLEVDPAALAAFGLDKPGFTLEFLSGQVTHQLRVGHKAPGDRTFYAQADNHPQVILINAPDKESLDRNVNALRDKTVLALDPDKVTVLTLKTGALNLEVQRSGSPPVWTAPAHPGVRLRGDKIDALLRQLSLLRVLEFVSDQPTDLKRYGLAAPQAQIAVTQDGHTTTLLVGSPQKERCYAQKQGQPPVFLIGKEVLAGLPASVLTWEDRRLWAGPGKDIEQIAWGPPDQLRLARKDKDGWQLTDAQGQPQGKAVVRGELPLYKLTELEFAKPAPDAPPGPPRFIVRLRGPQEQHRLTLEEFPAPPEFVLLRVTGPASLTVLMPERPWREWLKELDALGNPGDKKPPQ